MRIHLTGHPLHTRLQTIAARADGRGTVTVEGNHLDLRKRGFVPVGADLQAAGVVHQMSLHGVLDPRSGRMSDIATAMTTPAFEASELTCGESCRDVAGRHRGLDGLVLGADAERAVRSAMGGASGCSHLLALTQLATSSLRHAASGAGEWASGPPRRLFHRSVVIDGAEPAARAIEIGAQLSDLYFSPAAAVANPMDRFARQYELRLFARVDLDSVTLTELAVAERARGRADLAVASWRRRDELVTGLLAVPFLGGFARRVFEQLGDASEDRPLADLLLALAPAFIQICACFSKDWPSRCMAADTLVGIGGIPDACYMWRRDGALHSRRKRSDPMGKVGG